MPDADHSYASQPGQSRPGVLNSFAADRRPRPSAEARLALEILPGILPVRDLAGGFSTPYASPAFTPSRASLDSSSRTLSVGFLAGRGTGCHLRRDGTFTGHADCNQTSGGKPRKGASSSPSWHLPGRPVGGIPLLSSTSICGAASLPACPMVRAGMSLNVPVVTSEWGLPPAGQRTDSLESWIVGPGHADPAQTSDAHRMSGWRISARIVPRLSRRAATLATAWRDALALMDADPALRAWPALCCSRAAGRQGRSR